MFVYVNHDAFGLWGQLALSVALRMHFDEGLVSRKQG